MTKFKGNQEEFNKNYLNMLISDANSGIFVQECKYHIALHPAQLNDFGISIKDVLARKTARYDETFSGILMGYQDIKLPSQLGNIGLDNTYIHLDIQAKFFVFRPTIGMVLKGKVTRTTKDHVGCLVYKKFNIALLKPKNDDDDDSWLGQKAKVDNEVEFEITYVDFSARIPHIRGDIRTILNVDPEILAPPGKSSKNRKIIFDINEEEPSSKKKSKKNHRKDAAGNNMEEIDSVIPEVLEESLSQKKTKKTKSKKTSMFMQHADEIQPETNDEAKQLSKGEKKKLKKEQQLKLENEEFNLSSESLDIKDEEPANVDEINRKGSIGNLDEIKQESDDPIDELSYQKPSKKRSKKASVSMEYADEIQPETPDEANQLSKKERKKLKKEQELKLKNEELNLSSESLHMKDEELVNEISRKRYIGNLDEMKQEVPEAAIEELSYQRPSKKRSKTVSISHADKIQPDTHDEAKQLSKKERKKVKQEQQLKLQNEALNLSSESLHIKDEEPVQRSIGNLDEIKEEVPIKELLTQHSKKEKNRVKKEKRLQLETDKFNLSSESLHLKDEEPENSIENKIKLEVPEEDIRKLCQEEKKRLKTKKTLKLEDKELDLSSGAIHIKKEEAINAEFETEPKKNKKKKQKDRRRAKSESEHMDISLESLDLKGLFADSSVNFDNSITQSSANSPKKPKRKRAQSMSQDTYLENIKLEMDSDLEKIIGTNRKKLKS